jgi:hypothetical protein
MSAKKFSVRVVATVAAVVISLSGAAQAALAVPIVLPPGRGANGPIVLPPNAGTSGPIVLPPAK